MAKSLSIFLHAVAAALVLRLIFVLLMCPSFVFFSPIKTTTFQHGRNNIPVIPNH
ncbi:hypothetical protein [Bacillus sp. NPDC093026]|uniref:hypothetical protein n=1 Tax=Bacillus sp. NPDC093026 TaxID=3363948 RepID=UPI0038031644